MAHRPGRWLAALATLLVLTCLLAAGAGSALAIQQGTVIVRPRFVIVWIGSSVQTIEITTKPSCSILMFNCPAPGRLAQRYYLASWHFVITPNTETGRQIFRVALTP
jgi:hypothetical protein